ncbi:hypothetical protein OC846_005326 [Tilletia horrida]|uniref:Uncharacterized protein n=1 Tax=Tilletia horrida TaxID=155126 RepID=A0AAN6GL11_9BASI|nr:hypothetical protein OC846_005326 [Tilletia horrida]KAK0562075.1 hypothetical protein OC861_005512 [Tilletia horrida]
MYTAREFLAESAVNGPGSRVNTTTGAAAGASYDLPPPGAPPLPPAFYARIAPIPLLLSPALRLPPPISFPQDLHPLPTDIAPYMIYPFSLERHVLHPDPSAGGPLVEEDPLDILQAAKDLLDERAAATERDRKAALQRIAPGWADLEGRGGVLEPKKQHRVSANAQPTSQPPPVSLFDQLTLGSSTTPPNPSSQTASDAPLI